MELLLIWFCLIGLFLCSILEEIYVKIKLLFVFFVEIKLLLIMLDYVFII